MPKRPAILVARAIFPEVLATLARSLFKENFRESLRRAHDAEVIAELINSTLVFFDH